MTALPTGRRGQALAVGLALLVVAVIWLGVASPALAWFAERADLLSRQQTLAARMASLAASGPALQRRVAQMNEAAPAPQTVLEGATDAVAGAALQQAVQDMAARTGATVTSAEALPADDAGTYRRISLHVTVNGSWPSIVALFGAVADAAPRMLVDDVSLRPALALGATDRHPLEASFTIIAFHTGRLAAP